MKKVIKWGLIGFISLVIIGVIASRGGDKNSSVKEASTEEIREAAQQKVKEKLEQITTPNPTLKPEKNSPIVVIENGKKVFNDLGWKLYTAQFIKPKPVSDSDCHKEDDTCPYWEELAKQHSVDVSDVKFVLYEASGVALSAKYQKIYDEYNKGLDVVFPKTEENGEKFEKEFAKKHGLRDYELKAITTKGLLYKPDERE